MKMYEEHIVEKFESPRAFRYAMRTKAAPKLGRTIGSAARMGKRVVPFDPNAINADGDMTVQDGTIWERPATPRVAGEISKLNNQKQPRKKKLEEGGLSSGAKYSLFDALADREIDDGEEIPEEWFSAAEIIDAAIIEQIEIAIGVKNPENAVFSMDLLDNYQVDPGKKKPSLQYVLKNALDKFNEDTGSDKGLPEIVAEIVEKTPQYSLFDSKIKGYFFASDSSRQAHAMELHKKKNYKYGDRSAIDGSEIRPTSTGWLNGLSPKQIANIVVPESLDDAFEMFLDFHFGASDAEQLRNSPGHYMIARATYKQTITTVLQKDGSSIDFIDASPEEMQEVRDLIEKNLNDNPLFLSAVHKFGMPTVLAVKPVDEDQVDPDELIGWYSRYGFSIMIPTTSLSLLRNADEIMDDTKSVVKNEDSLEIQYGAFRHSTSARAVTHEWSHYLQDMALAKISQSNNGTLKQSGIKYDSDLDKIGKLASILTDQVTRDSAKIQMSQEDSEMTSKIMKQAKDYNLELREAMAKVQDLVIKQIINDGKNNSDLDIESEMGIIEKEVSETKNKYDSLGIISAPSFYSTQNESEQFAEIVAHFMSGPEYRSLLTATTLKELEAIFNFLVTENKK